MELINVKDLSKTYSKVSIEKNAFWTFSRRVCSEVKALDGVSFKINKGERVAYLGVNGSGKSTTIKILSGILYPSGGSVVVDGLVPYEKRIENAKKIGVVFGQRAPLYWDLPLLDSLKVLNRMYDHDEQYFAERLSLLDEVIGLDDILYSPVRQLSLGQKMMANIICAVFHNPSLLILDEPTVGLDVFAKERVRNLVLNLNKTLGTTVFLASHDLADVVKICSRVIIINKGKVIYQGTMDDAKEQFATSFLLRIHTCQGKEAIPLLSADVSRTASLSPQMIEFELLDYSSVNKILSVFEKKGIKYSKIEVSEPSFEDVVRRILTNI